LFADFRLTEEELNEIRQILEIKKSIDRIYTVELKDKAGKVYCVIEKTIYIARNYYEFI